MFYSNDESLCISTDMHVIHKISRVHKKCSHIVVCITIVVHLFNKH